MVWIYILELKDGKYYVGKSGTEESCDKRIQSHFDGDVTAAAWTQKYHPVKVVEKIPYCDDYDEDKYTKMYMDKYGIDNVRGGSYVTINLDKSVIKHLQQSSTATNDRCFGCNKNGHFVKDCPERSDIKTPSQLCTRCGRNNHTIEKCYAKKDLQGNIIYDNNSSDSSDVIIEVNDNSINKEECAVTNYTITPNQTACAVIFVIFGAFFLMFILLVGRVF